MMVDEFSSAISYGHSELEMSNDGAWRCRKCNRQGSAYTLPSRQPCQKYSEDMGPIVNMRESLEEALVTSGVSPQVIDHIFKISWLDDWLSAIRQTGIPFNQKWLATPSEDLNDGAPLAVLSSGRDLEAVWQLVPMRYRTS